MSDITLYTPIGLAARARAEAFADEALSANTRRAYRADWADFVGWCGAAGASPLPADPADIAAYLASIAPTRSPATLQRRLAAIGLAHRLAGHEWIPNHPKVRNTMRGLLRTYGRPPIKATAILSDAVRAMVVACEEDARGLRDRAVLLLGFAGALRRSEIVGLRLEHIVRTSAGLRVQIIGSKTDQAREGQEIALPPGRHAETCPIGAFSRWQALLGERTGAVFRRVGSAGQILHAHQLSPRSVQWILERRARAAGIDIEAVQRFSPHGLRSGFITEAVRAGARDDQVMPHTRHRDLATFRGYVQASRLEQDSPVKLVNI